MGQGLAKVVFQPPMPTYERDSNLLWLHTAYNDVIPAFHITRPDRYFTLLFSHGNAEDLGLIISWCRDVGEALQVNVFSYEYAGYGMSTGTAREPTVYADIEAAFKYLRDDVGVPWQRIVPYGRSIGTGPSVHLATRTAVRGVVLQSGMMSIYRIPFHFRYTMPGDLFTNVDKLARVSAPVLIIHGTRDEIVPIWNGEGLFHACARRGIAYDPFWVEGADHNNLESMAGEEFFERFRTYLKYLETEPISDGLQRQADHASL